MTTTASETRHTTTIVSSRKFDTASITKLNSDNFRVWKMRLTSLFESHNLMQIVNGTKIRPALSGSEQTAWDQGNSDAKTTMLLAMSDSEVETVSGCTTAAEIWRKLGTIYLSVSGESKQIIWQKYYSVMAGPGKTPSKAMTEIQNYASQLRSMGVQIDDEMEVARIVSSLMDEKYRHFREAWRSVDVNKQSTALLLSRLKTWEMEEEEQVKALPKTEATKAYTAGKRSVKPKKSKEELAELKKRTKCHQCKETGHWKTECPNKKKQGKPDSSQETNTRKEKAYEGAYGFSPSDDEWVCDSGANRHYCGRLDWFTEMEKYSKPKKVAIADNSDMSVVGVGKVKVKALIDGNWNEISIHDVEYVPGGVNLFSENILLDKGFEVHKNRSGKIVFFRDGKPDIQAERKGGLQIMMFKPIINKAMTVVKTINWHQRLGHINSQFLKMTAKKVAAYGLEDMTGESVSCDVCPQAKSTKQSYKTSEKLVVYKPGESIHADLGYATAVSHRGNRYFLVTKDAGSSFRQIYCQKTKDETVRNLKDAINFLSNQTGNSVKLFRSDNGTEFCNKEFRDFLSEKGIQFGLNAPYTPQSNGMVEREVRTEQEAARAMLIQCQLSEKHWDDAIQTAAYILNRTLSSKNKDKTPFELIFNKKPSLHHVRVFGCKAFVHIMDKTKKWGPKAIECYLVGYNSINKNYVLYVPSESKYIEQAKHVEFREEFMRESESESKTSQQEEDESNPVPELDSSLTLYDEAEYLDEDNLIPSVTGNPFPTPDSSMSLSWAEEMELNDMEEDAEEAMEEARNSKSDPKQSGEAGKAGIAERRPQRQTKPIARFQAGFSALSALTVSEPKCYKDAVKSADAGDWIEAMDSEMRSQHENNTWHLVKSPLDKKVLKCRWVFKVKTDPDGNLEKYKARLVVKGYNQVEGLDYEETFAPVCRYETIRIMLSMAVQEKWDIKQFDIGTAFLNSPLTEETYMEQPEGYEVGSNLVCKLDKGIYGLKQAPRAWHQTMKEKLGEMGFSPFKSDSCVYKKENKGKPIFVVMYVDDGLIMGKVSSELKREIDALQDSFKVTVQPLNRFLGIEMIRNENGIFIHQKKYIDDVLKRFNMSECKTLDIPMQPGLQLEGSKPPDTNFMYQELVGSLLFLARCTRPDITYAVHYLSRFFSNYGKSQWESAKKILQYLKGTKELGILYSREEDQFVCGFVDADYGSDRVSRKSTTGCLFTFNGAPVVWISKRQTCIALSSTESEYIALAQGGKEAVWITRIYSELGMSFQDDPICLKTDSQSAMKLAKNPEHHDKSKHIDIRHHYIRQLVESEKIILEYIPDKIQPADILTKSIVKENFLRKREFMGMQSPPKESAKRSALSSVIRDPKRPNLFWTLLMLLMTMLTMGGASDVHKIGLPVLWRRSLDPVIIGFEAVTMKTKFISPCRLIPLDDVEPRIGKLMVKECQKAYEEIFVSKLQEICPMEKELIGRQKRLAFLAIGFLLVVVLASAGVGMAGFAISKTYEVETRQDELKKVLNELEVKVFTENKQMKVLQLEIRKIASQVDVLTNDFNIFKEKVVELQYLVSYLTSKLVEGRKSLRESGSAWKKGRLTEDFFEYLNFTLPCKEECPVEYGIFHSCTMAKDKEQILLDFSLPRIDKNLTRVEADPFFFMNKRGNNTCKLRYTGPMRATISLQEDCVYETHNEKPRHNLDLATLSNCRNSSSLNNIDSYYEVERCKVSTTGDEKEFIQVKFYDNEYHIYCAGSHYSIGKRVVKCPLKVFTLPLSITFTLNEVEYRGHVLKIIYREQEDPFIKEHVNWHLNPQVNWSNLAGELDEFWNSNNKKIQEEAKDLKVFEFQQQKGFSVIEVISCIIGTVITIVLLICIIVCVKKRSKREKSKQDKDKVKDNDKSEDLPLTGMGHQLIIQT